ncbi:histidine N-alpha-methyltransferase-like [Mercenaria mercenaria]|uniref:histidine N-alpha-methyltransferase-like n=1 Tax=Mercenaria mercenaria TaxID=6596 RepID=UPI00234FA088|nr:histidine N-alpha-methyltransferase-like [Mercenaria mercenaria]
MDIKTALIEGLQSNPKYLPVWYRYDKQGSLYNDKCLSDNKFYYFYKSELNVISTSVKEIIDQVASPCILVEMGSGNSEKSRTFIDAILQRQKTLTYIPVDISADFLQECSDALSVDYGEKLNVKPIAGDYSVGIQQISSIPGRKLIIWLGGGFQNQPYSVQVQRIHSLSQTMTEEDRLLIALDITQDAEAVENAYLDPTGVAAPLYLNALWRLNREYGGNIDTDKFQLEAKFERSTEADRLSRLVLKAVSKCDQRYNITGLGIDVTFKTGEYLQLHEGEGVSCKYSEHQIRTLAQKGGQRLDKIWTDSENHVALCFIAK